MDPRNGTDGRCWWAIGEVPAGKGCLEDRDCLSGECAWHSRLHDAYGHCAKAKPRARERRVVEYAPESIADVLVVANPDAHEYIPQTQMALHREARFFLCDAAVGLARGVGNLGLSMIDGLVCLFMQAFDLRLLQVNFELYPGQLRGTIGVKMDAVIFGNAVKFDLSVDLSSILQTIANLLLKLGLFICDGLSLTDICKSVIESIV